MSTAVISTSAAQSRFFVFENECAVEGTTAHASDTHHPRSPVKDQKSKILSSVIPASRLEARPAPEMVSSGIAAIDALAGGLPRGCLTEIFGPASSGRTTLLLAALAVATRRGEFCAIVDASDALDPNSVAAAGVDLDRLLWVRCGESSQLEKNSTQRHPSTTFRAGGDTEKNKLRDHSERSRFSAGAKDPKITASKSGTRCPISRALFTREVGIVSPGASSLAASAPPSSRSSRPGGELPTEKNYIERRFEQLLRATDLLLESGGFGLIALDLCDLPVQTARRIPMTTWFRFRRAVEHTPTVLLAIERQSIAGSCSSLLVKLGTDVFTLNSAAKRRENSSQNTKSNPAVQIEQAAQQRPSAAHSVTCGSAIKEEEQAPEGRKKPSHVHLLTELQITAEIVRSRLERKPVRTAEISFASKTAWTG
jgi:recombination protein RecA